MNSITKHDLVTIILHQCTKYFIQSDTYNELFLNMLKQLMVMYQHKRKVELFVYENGLKEALYVALNRDYNIVEIILKWYNITKHYDLCGEIFICNETQIFELYKKYERFQYCELTYIIHEAIIKNNIIFLNWLANIIFNSQKEENFIMLCSCDINDHKIDFYFHNNTEFLVYDWLNKHFPVSNKKIRHRALFDTNTNVLKWLHHKKIITYH